ncbi:MAG TPA: amino acid adenylation domain-containing protein [Streptosporangiaceae bacterium]
MEIVQRKNSAGIGAGAQIAPESRRARCLPDLLREQARARPGGTAVVHGDERLTFGELAAAAARLAAHLRDLGVGPDDRVGLFVEPSIELIVGVWGILCAGGAYVPLSPDYPDERLRYMIEDSAAEIILTQEGLRPALAALAPHGTRIVTTRDAAESGRSRPSAVPAGPLPGGLAYVIYTSGSTGRPKGVMIEHRAIVNQLEWLRDSYGIGPRRTILQKTPISFDAAQWEILATGCGGTVVMGGPGAHRDPQRLIDIIIRHRVTTLQCVPTLLGALLDLDELRECTSLRQIFSGGEALSRILASRCLDTLPDCDLVNLYGPTECTINSSALTVDRAAVRTGPNTISIGRPVRGTRYYILDADRRPVAPGEVGELHIGGVQLARGYLGRPDLTADRFVADPFAAGPVPGAGGGGARLFRTGDLAQWNDDGTVQFVGRTDNQVKLHGFRIELDEIRLAIENHEWVKNAAVIVKDDPRTGFQHLLGFIELNPKEAALMDQGEHGAHHLSKEGRLQTRMQLSDPGVRDAGELAGRPVVDLPGREPTAEQRRLVFARKTYRFYEGGEVTKEDVLRLLDRRVDPRGGRRGGRAAPPRGIDAVGLAELGAIMRYFGQFRAGDRLLPKYGYASPGSLYATQLYLELAGVAGLAPGLYYYHPVRHRLVLIGPLPDAVPPRLRIHFIGKKRAIRPVYKKNIQEVLEIETGHIVGLFEELLPGYGLDIRPAGHTPAVKDALDCADEDYYLGTFAVEPYAGPRRDEPVEIYVQAHPGKVAGLPAGQYRYRAGELVRISDELVMKRHVIAINQQVYERASLGITVVARAGRDWLRYIDLGRVLQHLQMNDVNLGFMSAGYSSKTGHDLPAATRMADILRSRGVAPGPSYFFVGGRISDEQIRSDGMHEDVVHMKGPTELIRDDLAGFLPRYMMPNRIVVVDALPLTANGKVDRKALAASDQANVEFGDRPFVAPRTPVERTIHDIWRRELGRDAVSVEDDFFASGGNSLIAVRLVNRINRELRCDLPLQVLFDCPTIEELAAKVDGGTAAPSPSSRMVRLRGDGAARPPVYCWPGLGGYAMNLRQLAGELAIDRPVYGVQAYGLNAGESPYPTIEEMAAADVELIRRRQPVGPYTLWGYSFGARVAFEAAHQLERAGERVDHLFLIAPGSPKVRSAARKAGTGRDPVYHDKTYVSILFSVFAGSVTDPALAECLEAAEDEDGFVAFVCGRHRDLDPDLVRRIVRVVQRTYQFAYTAAELAERQIRAPITIFKARGDDESFIEQAGRAATVVALDADHYGVLKESGVGRLVDAIHERLREGDGEASRAA